MGNCLKQIKNINRITSDKKKLFLWKIMWSKFNQNRPHCLQIKGCDRHTWAHTHRRTDMPRPGVNIFSPEMSLRYLLKSNLFIERVRNVIFFKCGVRNSRTYITLSESSEFQPSIAT